MPPLTESSLARKATAQERLLVRLVRECLVPVDKAVADAAAHAARALTDTLKRRPDGRATLRHVRRSPSAAAARRRLAELLDALAGPSIDATTGLVRDARVRLYEDATARWAALLPAEVLRPDAGSPRASELLAVRRLALHGKELRAELGHPIDQQAAALSATLGQAAGRSTPERVATDLLDAWAARAKARIGQAVRLAVLDGGYRCDVAAGWYAVRPEMRDGDDPLMG